MKKNFRKIPAEIVAKLKTIKTSDVVAGCAVMFRANILAAGQLKHLGIMLTNDGLKVPESVIPTASQGKFSRKNVEGLVIIRKDLPKETYYRSVEAPNWGNYGTHTVDLPNEKYPRDFDPPRELAISVKCKNTEPGLPGYVIAFKVNEVLEKTSKQFNKRLFENLNLLQENVGACGIELADTALSDYMKSLHVSWQLLPPGSREDVVARIFPDRSPTAEEKEVAGLRYDFFMSLKPKKLVFGSSGFRRYFGALLEDNLVVFENIQYGNAVYILFDNWKELSKRSRIDLISHRYGTDFERVIHKTGWKGQVRAIVAAKRDGEGT